MSEPYIYVPDHQDMLKRELLAQARSLQTATIIAAFEERVEDAAALLVRTEAILDFLELLS